MKKILILISLIIIVQLAGLIGSVFTTPNINSWYSTLNRPVIAPPNWVFAPVWTTLFLFMGVALFLVWKNGVKNKQAKIAITLFFIQLILNILWSVLFFGLQNPLIALVEIIFLAIFILLTMIYFYRVNKWAGLLLLPYFLWVLFASVLNFNFWLIN